MPELPEVAYQKKYADATILHKKIIKVETGDKKIYQSDKIDFEETLTNNQFTGSERLGKYLFLNLEKKGGLVVHFGMTGKLEYYQHIISQLRMAPLQLHLFQLMVTPM